jgi:hypothetical protein
LATTHTIFAKNRKIYGALLKTGCSISLQFGKGGGQMLRLSEQAFHGLLQEIPGRGCGRFRHGCASDDASDADSE